MGFETCSIQNDSNYNCDCVIGMKRLPEETIPLTVTSPPYDQMRTYGGHDFKFEEIAEELYRVTMPGGVLAWVVKDQIKDGAATGTSHRQCLHFVNLGFRLHFVNLGFRLHDTIQILQRGSRSFGNVRYGPPEYAFIFSKGKPRYVNIIRDRPNKTAGSIVRYYRRLQNGDHVPASKGKLVAPWGARKPAWEYTLGRGTATEKFAFEHPALMSEALAEDLILSWSRPGDLVLDPMCGAGTTCKMALLNFRNYLGFEVFDKYHDLAQRRINMSWVERRRRLLEFFGSYPLFSI